MNPGEGPTIAGRRLRKSCDGPETDNESCGAQMETVATAEIPSYRS